MPVIDVDTPASLDARVGSMLCSVAGDCGVLRLRGSTRVHVSSVSTRETDAGLGAGLFFLPAGLEGTACDSGAVADDSD